MGAMGGLMTILVILGFIVAVLWVFMPFAVFGIKDLVRDAIAEQKKTNALLERLIAQKSKE
jgi:predicted PurR-regulated permease PerM